MKGKTLKNQFLKKITTLVLGILLSLFSTVNFASAQANEPANNQNKNSFSFNVGILSIKCTEEGQTNCQEQSYLENAKDGNPLAAFILQIINFIVLISGSVSFLLIVVGGFMILSSAGNETTLNKGKDIIKIAIIGLVLTLSSFFIVAFVQSLIFGV